MEKNLEILFKKIEEKEPSSRLEGLILSRIEKIRSRRERVKIELSWVGVLASSIAFVYAGLVIGKSFLNSEFWSLLKLAFSDISVVLSNWNSYLFSLLETLPVFSLVIFMAPILTALWSLSVYLGLNKKYHHRHFNLNIYV